MTNKTKSKKEKSTVSDSVSAGKAIRTGARCLIEGLEREGCEVIFGYPGGAILEVFNEIYNSPMKMVLPRHEQGAAHMADAYARTTGKVGCCIVTSGPGATNTVTGLATANMDGIPIVCISGQVSTSVIGTDAFQEADICGVTRPVTKHNYLVRDVNDLPRIIVEAFHIARTGRPGPVLIDMPKDVQIAKTAVPFPDGFKRPGYKPSYEGHPKMIERLAAMINSSHKPLLYVGAGVISSDSSELLTELARKAQIPVATTLLGLGAFPETDELSLYMLGMHGTVASNLAVKNCDLLISVGARFDDRVTGKISEFALKANVAHIDIDPAAIGKNVRCDLPVVGDIKPVLTALLPQVYAAKRPEWFAQYRKWMQDDPFSYDPSPTGNIMPQYVVEQVHEVSRGDALICTDVGQNQMFAAQFFRHTKPRRFLSSGGLGTMGYGLPAVIGAQFGKPDQLCVCITGDGGMQMNAQEIVVAVEHKLPIKVVILNNGYLGNVRQWQDMFYNRTRSAVTLTQTNRPPNEQIPEPEEADDKYLPDFVMLAKAHGAEARRITKIEDVKPTLEEAFASPEPWIMEFIVDPESNVFPMIPPGQSVDDTIRKI
ncbi:MAG: biosynthetic-type acetolactate synthase large subunit [Lentisphaerae bacterium]|nr:biosynthetic-type acetolactate synthase large subunit [Lentisphaerota bacterium]